MEMKDQPKGENLDYALRLMDQAPTSDLILLPEIWPSGFFCFDQYRAEAEEVNGPTVRAFQKRAKDRECYILMGSFVEKEGEKYYNTSLLLDPGGRMISRYRKIHLFGYRSEEKKILAPGRELAVQDMPWGKTGLSTCYDLRFPEFFRKMTDVGAKFFLVVSAWPQVRLNAWTLFNRARAHENLAYLISCNCAGSNNGERYAGHSMIVDPLGDIIAEGGEGECFVSAEIDPDLVDATRKDFPALDDRVFK